MLAATYTGLTGSVVAETIKVQPKYFQHIKKYKQILKGIKMYQKLFNCLKRYKKYNQVLKCIKRYVTLATFNLVRIAQFFLQSKHSSSE